MRQRQTHKQAQHGINIHSIPITLGMQGDTDQFLIREKHLRGNRAYALEQECRPELVVSCRKKASTSLAGWTAN